MKKKSLCKQKADVLTLLVKEMLEEKNVDGRDALYAGFAKHIIRNKM